MFSRGHTEQTKHAFFNEGSNVVNRMLKMFRGVMSVATLFTVYKWTHTFVTYPEIIQYALLHPTVHPGMTGIYVGFAC